MFVGHDAVQQNLLRIVDRPPSAVLLSGPAGVGKRLVMRTWAGLLLEGAFDGGMSERMSTGDQLDYLEVTDSGIGQIRTAIEWAYRAPIAFRYRVVAIPKAQALSVQAVDALLKTVEEPPPRTRFIFTLDEGHALAHTLAARTYQIRVGPLSDVGLHEVITSMGLAYSSETLRLALRLSRGRVSRVLFYLESGLAVRKALLELLVHLPHIADWQLIALLRSPRFEGVSSQQWVWVLEDLAQDAVAVYMGDLSICVQVWPPFLDAAKRWGRVTFAIASLCRVLAQNEQLPVNFQTHLMNCILQIKESTR